MPEGDTLRRLAARVTDEVVGGMVERSVFRHPRLALLDLTGRRLLDADAIGKHLLCRFDDATTLHLHLLMQGRVRFGGLGGVPPERRRFELHLDRGRMVGVDIPLLHHVPTAEESSLVGHLGPDLCGTYDHDRAVANLATAGDRPLSGALLDQQLVAGFGNIYAVETPFLCGLPPFAPIGTLDDLDALVGIGAALIRTNARLGPQNTTGRRMERSEHWVLSGGKRRCPLCGERLQRRNGEQTTWGRRTAWCPTCQPRDATTVDLERARRLLALHPARRLLGADGRLLDRNPPTVVTRR